MAVKRQSTRKPNLSEVAVANSVFGRSGPGIVWSLSDLVGQKGIKLFSEMRRDDSVKAAMSFKRDATLAAGWEVVSPEGKPDDWPVTTFVQRQFVQMDFSIESALRDIMSAMIYGFAVAEKVWHYVPFGVDAGLVGIKAIKIKRPEAFTFECDAFGNITDRGVLQNGIALPRDKFVVWTYGESFGDPYGESDLESAYRPWVVLNGAYRAMAALLERHGVPPVVAIYDPSEMTAQQVNDLKQLILNMQTATTALIPRTNKDAFEFWTPELAGQVSTVFVPAMELLKTDIARAALMPGYLGVTPDSMGSYARAKVTFDMFLLHIARVQQQLREAVVQEQIIKPLVELNFNTGGELPLFRFLPMTDELRDDLAKTWRELVTDNIVSPEPGDEDHIRSLLGFPKKPDRPTGPEAEEKPRLPLGHIEALAPAFTVNEIRAQMGYPPLPGEEGNKLFGAAPEPPPEPKTPDDPNAPNPGEGEAEPDEDEEDPDDEGDDEDSPKAVEKARADAQRVVEFALRKPMQDDGEGPPPVILPDDVVVTPNPTSEPEKRADLAAIGGRLDDSDNRLTEQLAAIARKAVLDQLAAWTKKPPKRVSSVKFSLPDKAGETFRKAMLALFRGARADTRKEVNGAEGRLDVTYEPTSAIAFLEGLADFAVKGMTNQMTEIVRLEIMNGLRDGRPFTATANVIQDALSAWIGEPGVDPKALRPDRILTAVRTVSTQAYNTGRVVEARQLGDLVKGMQFSAVLDSRTTPICRHMHGKVWRMNDEDFGRFTPPLHFRCRSILLPVTLDIPISQDPAEPEHWITPEERAEASRLTPGGFGGSYRDGAKK